MPTTMVVNSAKREETRPAPIVTSAPAALPRRPTRLSAALSSFFVMVILGVPDRCRSRS
jgi:hypothetical protein